MNSDDLERRLRSAQASEAERADPGALLERVLSVPELVEPKRRRWWSGLWAGSRRHDSDTGPGVKGGPMMLTATRLAAAIAILALGGAVITAQRGPGPETVVPGAEAPGVVEWAPVTGSAAVTFDPANGTLAGSYSLSDARVSGEMVHRWYVISDQPGQMGEGMYWGTVSIPGEEGSDASWEGEWMGYLGSDGTQNQMNWLHGRGSYDGLSFLFSSLGQPDALQVSGIIYRGDIPPVVALGAGPATTD